MIKPMDAHCSVRGVALAKTLGVLDPLKEGELQKPKQA
jgi:hypothetical protein